MGESVIANGETSLQSNCVKTIARFTVDVANLNIGYVVSPNMTLNNLDWNVELRRKGDFVALILQSSSYNVSLWSCDAQATFKLFPQKELFKHDLERKLTKRTFTNRNSTYEIVDFVNYSDFLNYFVIDNQATFEIEISTCNSKTTASTGFQQIFSRLHIVLDNISYLTEKISSEVIVRDIRWNIRIEKKEGLIGVWLQAAESDLDISSTYDVTATIKLLTFDGSKQSITKSFSHAYSWGSTKGGLDSFVPFTLLMDKANKFVFEDKTHFLLEFRVEEPKSLWDFENSH